MCRTDASRRIYTQNDCSSPEIDATTGEITFTEYCYYCFTVKATNGCGTALQILQICNF